MISTNPTLFFFFANIAMQLFRAFRSIFLNSDKKSVPKYWRPNQKENMTSIIAAKFLLGKVFNPSQWRISSWSFPRINKCVQKMNKKNGKYTHKKKNAGVEWVRACEIVDAFRTSFHWFRIQNRHIVCEGNVMHVHHIYLYIHMAECVPVLLIYVQCTYSQFIQFDDDKNAYISLMRMHVC